MNQCDLVIFDCDGVLVDSERITNQIFCSMLNELGIPVTLDDMFEQFVGLSMPQCVSLITKLHVAPPPENFVAELRVRTTQVLKQYIRPIPGVTETLNILSIPYCVASSGDHDKIKLTLGSTGLLKHFDKKIFSVVDVERPKPAPDVFLFAAQKMLTDPSRCAVVEDTPTGIKAAIAAGMYVFGFSANTPAYRLKDAGAHETFTDMRQLPTLLNNMSEKHR